MQHLEGSGTPVLYIGHTVLKGLYCKERRYAVYAFQSGCDLHMFLLILPWWV
jgi:hypothetical protein